MLQLQLLTLLIVGTMQASQYQSLENIAKQHGTLSDYLEKIRSLHQKVKKNKSQAISVNDDSSITFDHPLISQASVAAEIACFANKSEKYRYVSSHSSTALVCKSLLNSKEGQYVVGSLNKGIDYDHSRWEANTAWYKVNPGSIITRIACYDPTFFIPSQRYQKALLHDDTLQGRVTFTRPSFKLHHSKYYFSSEESGISICKLYGFKTHHSTSKIKARWPQKVAIPIIISETEFPRFEVSTYRSNLVVDNITCSDPDSL